MTPGAKYFTACKKFLHIGTNYLCNNNSNNLIHLEQGVTAHQGSLSWCQSYCQFLQIRDIYRYLSSKIFSWLSNGTANHKGWVNTVLDWAIYIIFKNNINIFSLKVTLPSPLRLLSLTTTSKLNVQSSIVSTITAARSSQKENFRPSE